MNTQIYSAHRPRTNSSSIRAAINRRIRLGTTSTSNKIRALILSFLAVAPIFTWVFMANFIRECYYSNAMAARNGDRVLIRSIECLIFNRECSCGMSTNETQFADRCLTRQQLFAMRIIPGVSFFLQMFAFREFISLGKDGNHFSNPLAWVMFTLVSIGIAIAIAIVMFSTHCYHLLLGLATFVTSALLVMLVIHEFERTTRVSENEHWRRNRNQWARSVQPIDNDPRSWKVIL
jgi:hypothetical protein